MTAEPAEDIELICVRCGAEISFGSFASSRAEDTQQSVAFAAAGQIGWRQTFAGWQCPHHPPAGQAPKRPPTAQGIEAQSATNEGRGPKDESPVAKPCARTLGQSGG